LAVVCHALFRAPNPPRHRLATTISVESRTTNRFPQIQRWARLQSTRSRSRAIVLVRPARRIGTFSHMPRLKITVFTITLALACNTCWAQLYPSPGINPYTNPLDALDVDDNGLIQPRDLVLVINRLEALDDAKKANLNAAHTLSALAATPAAPTYFWDTNADGSVTPIDALMVINHLNSNASIAPEPSTMVLAALGLLTLFGCVWRRKRLPTKA
jgi:hypothetical protein